MAEAFDYIITGAGSAGCVLASRLTHSKTESIFIGSFNFELAENRRPDSNPKAI